MLTDTGKRFFYNKGVRMRYVENFDEVVSDLKARNLLDLKGLFPELARATRHGSRSFAVLCPFHSERHASLLWYPASESWSCMGCGASGSVIDYYVRRRGVGWLTAVKDLSKIFGISLKWGKVAEGSYPPFRYDTCPDSFLP